jgi:hypothetical protein
VRNAYEVWKKSERKRPFMYRWKNSIEIFVKGMKYEGDEFNWPRLMFIRVLL